MADLSEAAKRALEAGTETPSLDHVLSFPNTCDYGKVLLATQELGVLKRRAAAVEALKASVAKLERELHNSRTALRLAVAHSKGASFTLRRGTKTTLGWEIWRHVEKRDSVGTYRTEQIIPLEAGPDGLPVVSEEAFKALEELT